MARHVYLSNDVISLSSYISDIDDPGFYNCWMDEETQSGYNYKMTCTFEDWKGTTPVRSRFIAVITRLSDNASLGVIFLSPEGSPPDLAIMIYKPFRRQGYGTAAFALGVRYCFDILGLDKVYAGCYPHNAGSMKMLSACGFLPHPEGDLAEKHIITGDDITQFDFVAYNSAKA